jgi:hypothetical protein
MLITCHANTQVLQDANPQGIRVGAQSVFFEPKGAFTAAVSAPMVKSVGAELVLVGHSERRSVFKESNADINRSLKQVLAHDMVPVLCVGETLQEYESGSMIPFDLAKGACSHRTVVCVRDRAEQGGDICAAERGAGGRHCRASGRHRRCLRAGKFALNYPGYCERETTMHDYCPLIAL